jgi:predicted O-methyltransferase YrrM
MKFRWYLSYALVRTAVWLIRLSGWYDGYWNFWRQAFTHVEQNDLHILPVHYYSPIPDTRALPDELWSNLRSPSGIDLKVDSALAWLKRLSQTYGQEYNTLAMESIDPRRFHLNNAAFTSGDAEVLYAIVRDLKPRKIVEIGSGNSTLLTCEAIRANQSELPSYRCEFTLIEPFPPAIISPPPAEVTHVEKRPVQQVALSLFSTLDSGDLLFIDSSHVARIGSDVVHEYLTILPLLAPGVVVHIHDIFIPAEYPRLWIDEFRFFWNEQYMLEAFLSFNAEFEIIMPLHAMWRLHQDLLQKMIPSLDTARHSPASFWIRRRNYTHAS